MTIVKVVTKEVVPLPQLFRLALKFIFDRSNFTVQEGILMENGIINWSNHVKMKEEIGSFVEDEAYKLGIIALLLKQNEEGKLERRKGLFKEHNIPYQKYYHLKEFYTPEDFERGKQIMEELKRVNPEENL